MIKINTTESWIEFDSIPHPIKSDDSICFLSLKLEKRNAIEIGFDFGKIIDGDFVSNSKYQHAVTCAIKSEVSKTDQEIKDYSFNQLHLDAKEYLETHCISPNTTFAIL